MKLTNQSTLTSKITLPDDSTEDVTTLSNESNTEYMTGSFLKVKSASKTFVKPSDEIEYTIVLTNNSDYDITDITFKDTISSDAQIVAGSVTIDDTEYASYDPTVGFEVPDIATTASTTIKYKAQVVASPVGNVVSNTATITYSVNEISDLEENTNTVSLPISNNSIVLTKTSDKSAVIAGQTLTYQITIENTGNITNTDLIFTDPLPSGVTFVADSVKVDDVPKAGADPVAGFALDDLVPSAKFVVTFDVTVN